MPATYQGEVRVQGRRLRGWLANLNDPYERVGFDLVIDGVAVGYYTANQPYQPLERYTAFGDGAHGFSFQLDRDWITGGQQTVTLAVEDAKTGVELHAALGPAAGVYLDDEGPQPRKPTPAEAAAYRELTELRRLRKVATDPNDRLKAGRRYFEVLDSLSLAEVSDRERGWRNSVLLGRELHESARFAEAIAVAERILAVDPQEFRALMAKGRSLVAMNRANEARPAFAQALALQPDNLGAKFYMRVTKALSPGEPGAKSLTLGTVVLDAAGNIAGAASGTLAERLAALPSDWLRLTASKKDNIHSAEAKDALNEPFMQQVGYATAGANAYWRRDALVALAESGLIANLGEGVLARWQPVFTAPGEHRIRAAGPRKAALIVPEDTNGLDDVDAFLAGATKHYRAMGFQALTRRIGADTGDTAASLRRFVLEEGVALVHAVSGLGYIIADALAYTNIPFIYGVHFWRDMLGDADGKDAFDDETGAPRLRPEFDYILSSAATVYASSPHMREIVEQCYDVRCAVLAIPAEVA